MKVLFVIDGIRKGGKERRFIQLVENLLKKDIDFRIVLIHKEIEYIISDEIKAKLIFIPKKRRKSIYPLFSILKIVRLYRPNVIHTWSLMMTTYSLFASILCQIPLVNSQISDAPEFKSRWSSILLLSKINFIFSKRIIANSFAGLKSYREDFNKISRVVYNGFDFDRLNNYLSPNINSKYNIETKFVVGMAASFTDRKDYPTYIKAAELILEERNDITFICMGDGPLLENNKKQTLSKHNDKILFLGKVSNVEELMAICDIGVLTTYTEGISNSLIEFSALEKPIIATNGGGTNEIIVDGINGYLIDFGDYYQLKDKICKLIDNPILKQKLGENAKNVVIDKFGINRMVDEFYGIYKELV